MYARADVRIRAEVFRNCGKPLQISQMDACLFGVVEDGSESVFASSGL
jgi:hypothetical protein